MRALIAMTIALALLVVLLRNKVKIGRSMLFSATILAALLGVSPAGIYNHLIFEARNKPLTQTTAYLLVSLIALVFLVNVLGAVMRRTGISDRLLPAMGALFRSRRAALTSMPLIMGMLPTPGGIMLSAPMVRDLGDNIGIDRSRAAAINFYFRHLWESVWPLFPAIPLVQGILGVSAFAIISHNIIIPTFGILGGTIFLLRVKMPPKQTKDPSKDRHLAHNLRDFAHAFWPIALTAILYTAFNVPPAVGIFIAVIGVLALHKLPAKQWLHIFKTAGEADICLLILGALFFKLNLETAGAVGQVVELLTTANVPPRLIIFLLPCLVAFLTGMTMPTVAITFPFLAAFIGTGTEAKMPLETLAFAGLLFGLCLTPVHLCLPLSAAYFQTPLSRIIAKLIAPAVFIATAGIVMAIFLC